MNSAGDDTYVMSSELISVKTQKHENVINVVDDNGVIIVNITDDDNNPVSGMGINVTLGDGTVIANGTTDERGISNITIPLPLGEYTITITTQGDYNNNPITKTITINIPLPESTLNSTKEEMVLGDSTNLTAEFFIGKDLAVPDGKAIFILNDKIIRNNRGEPIFVDVVGGKAVMENIITTSEWLKEDTTIQALYCGNEEINPIYTDKIAVNVTKPEAVINITSDLVAIAGKNVTLTAKVTSGGALVNTGRVSFKLNGKTLKGENGKVLYVNVENGLATVNYTIPAKTKARTYKLTVVFTDTSYNRAEVREDFVISKV